MRWTHRHGKSRCTDRLRDAFIVVRLDKSAKLTYYENIATNYNISILSTHSSNSTTHGGNSRGCGNGDGVCMGIQH